MFSDLENKIKSAIRDVPNFPKPGILFKDITPIMLDAVLMDEIAEAIVLQFKEAKIDAVAGIESRGYLFGVLIAQKLKVPFIMIRKEGKLPAKTIKQSYDLEYGTATIEVHDDAIVTNSNVLIHDDLLATGGTAVAAAKLIQQKANVVGFSFVIELAFLNGANLLQNINKNVQSLITYS
ncbi:adenine phosphoribosyltransferase [Wenyingzhuangia sp. 2_MG-2023]|uniref:adenine phosphoribosyltransferase n=1 Tax=Wenyingzhuangia sp. 2_MG-2023 TaxID=3062639 RepID=UPI0026E496E2|nr:adenine phosphoribosyltransferase [Wenyingzhuangia sp. 2_MG-2023]MDO6737414.1 adenine phosphoribosyltransferase [Wenyingzhuangia sp. 2_MG-2023]